MGIINVTRTLQYGAKILSRNTPVEPPILLETPKINTGINQNSTRLPHSTPDNEGLSSNYIYDFLNDLQNDKKLDMHNVLIVKNGKIITEAQFGPYSLDIPRYSFSACKSVVSLAIGCLYDEGKLSLDEKIVDIFKDDIPQSYKLFKTNITVHDVLTMRSGITFNEATSSVTQDWLDGYFSASIFGEVGKTFNYNSLNTYILSRIVIKKSGKSLSDYLNEKLFKNMGIYDYYWEKCPLGYEIGGWGLYIKHEDFAKIGMLVLNEGKYHNKRLISKEYINLATKAHATPPQDSGNFNYGYQIWVCKDCNAYLFNGMFGQNVFILKENNMVIVSGAGVDEMFQQSSYYGYVCKYFGNKIEDMQPSSDVKLQKLLDFIKTPKYDFTPLTYSNIKGQELNNYLKTIDGQTFNTSSNNGFGLMPFTTSLVSGRHTKGLKNVSFKYIDETLHIIFDEYDNIFDIPFKSHQFENTVLQFGINSYYVSTTGAFATTEDGDFVIKFRLYQLEMPTSKYFKFIFKQDKLFITAYETPGMPFVIALFSSYVSNIKTTRLMKQLISNIDIEKSTQDIRDRFYPKIELSIQNTNNNDLLLLK